MYKLTSVLLILVASYALSQAATVTLVDHGSLSSSFDWSDGDYWVGGVAPTANDDVVIGACWVTGGCYTGSTVSYTISLTSSVTVKSLQIADNEIKVTGGGSYGITITGAFKWYGGQIEADITAQGTTTIGDGVSTFASVYAYHSLDGVLTNTGTMTMSPTKFVMTPTSKIVNAASGTWTITYTFTDDNYVSWGGPYDNNNDPMPANNPIFNNQGTLIFDVKTRNPANYQDELFISAFLQTTSSSTVTVKSQTYVPAPPNFYGAVTFFSALVDPTAGVPAQHKLGGTWTVNGVLQITGGVIEVQSTLSATSTVDGAALVIGDEGDCQYGYSTGIGFTELRAVSSSVTWNAGFVGFGCPALGPATTKYTFKDLILYNVAAASPIDVTGHFEIRDSNTDTEVTWFANTVNILGDALFDRSPSMYFDDPLELRGAGSIVIKQGATAKNRWLHMKQGAAPTGAVTVEGTLTFASRQYVSTWKVPVNVAASGKLTTYIVQSSSDFQYGASIQAGGTIAGTIDFPVNVGLQLAGAWTASATAQFLSGAGYWLEYFAINSNPAAGRTLALAKDASVGNLRLDGNTIRVEASTNGNNFQFTNLWIANDVTFKSYNGMVTLNNYTLIADGAACKLELEGVTLVNKGVLEMTQGGVRADTTVGYKSWFYNSGTIIDKESIADLILLNTGTYQSMSSDVTGIFSNGTVQVGPVYDGEVPSARSLYFDTMILQPTNTLKVHVYGANYDKADYLQYEGTWCHLQGSIEIEFFTQVPEYEWVPQVGNSWNLFSFACSKPCIGAFSKVQATGLPDGLGAKVAYSVDDQPCYITVTVCSNSASGCNAATDYPKPKPGFPLAVLDMLPPGSYSPPAGVSYIGAPEAEPSEQAPSSATLVIPSIILVMVSALLAMI